MNTRVLPRGVHPPQPVFQVLVDFDAELKQGDYHYYEPYPLGYADLDAHLDGGIKPGELILLGGAPGIGKTITALQWARNMAVLSQVTATYVCFEHDERYLFHRLLCLESVSGRESPGLTMRDIREAVLNHQTTAADLQMLLQELPAARWAFESLTNYWDHLLLVKGDPIRSTWEVLDTYLSNLIDSGRRRVALFVDYLQKVPLRRDMAVLDDDARITYIVEQLKNLALAHSVPIVAVVAADKEGLKAERIRLHHLHGEAALAFECDIAIMMNPGQPATQPPGASERGAGSQTMPMDGGDPDLVSFTIEKNRTGPPGMEVFYHRRGAQFRFDPA